MKRYVMYWAVAGIVVPIMLIILAQLQGGTFESPYLALALWPSSILLMAIHYPGVGWAIFVYAISIMINVVLYSAVGAAVWWLRQFLKR
ncbi:MAG: hypothetical protein AABZ22_09205 [Nitrospirota bacterium]